MVVMGFLQALDQKQAVRTTLEKQFRLSSSVVKSLCDQFFSTSYLPDSYFERHSTFDIAGHIYLSSELLRADTEYLTYVSENGRDLTYILNIGRNFSEKIPQLFEINKSLSFTSFEIVATQSGIRILTLEREPIVPEKLETTKTTIFQQISSRVTKYSPLKNASFMKLLSSSPFRWVVELWERGDDLKEMLTLVRGAEHGEGLIVEQRKVLKPASSGRGTHFLLIAKKGFNLNDLKTLGRVLSQVRIDLTRAYFNQIKESGDERLGLFSAYSNAPLSDEQLETLKKELREAENAPSQESLQHATPELISSLLEAQKELLPFKEFLVDLEKEYQLTEKDHLDLSENCLLGFYKAAKLLGITSNEQIMEALLHFGKVKEFIVSYRLDNKPYNALAYRVQHSSVLGSPKGGLRLSTVVNFSEILALSFTMTWKCSHAGIMFGGAKGGMIISPFSFDGKQTEWFDTLASFGRSLFLVTGTRKDVPAGDVGCGALEIGHLFEGFKSALREVALTALRLKNQVALIGNELITTDRAKEILAENFGIFLPHDRDLVERLLADWHYLELVSAGQITGKPIMGLPVRNGSTGRGLFYMILTIIASRYIAGDWPTESELSSQEEETLKTILSFDIKIAAQTESRLYKKFTTAWDNALKGAFRKLLEGKKIAIQGAGKVGFSVFEQLSAFDVKVVGISDYAGAVFGESLNLSDVQSALEVETQESWCGKRRTVINLGKKYAVLGAQEGNKALLATDCDILILAALENAVNKENVDDVKARLVACGGNGPLTSYAKDALGKRGVIILYDFLANSGGVVASYFEWLCNLADRLRYEDEVLGHKVFSKAALGYALMPELSDRLFLLASMPRDKRSNSPLWEQILRDMSVMNTNKDLILAALHETSLETAGYIQAIERVLVADARISTPQDAIDSEFKEEVTRLMSSSEAKMHRA